MRCGGFCCYFFLEGGENTNKKGPLVPLSPSSSPHRHLLRCIWMCFFPFIEDIALVIQVLSLIVWCLRFLTFNFITQCHISQITVCCWYNGMNQSGQNRCSKMFSKSPGTYGYQFRVLSISGTPMFYVNVFICHHIFSHCTWVWGPVRFYANETFSYFSLISLHSLSLSLSSGIYLWV